MQIWLRDITIDEDLVRELPCDNLRLVNSHEYIIIDAPNGIGEYDNINDLNTLLRNVNEETIKILLSTYLFEEVIEMVENESYTVIDFDAETSNWNCDNGVPDTAEWLGRLMYDLGYNEFPCEVPKELEDYINWEANWTSLECEGWRTVRYNGNTYIVHR